MRRISLPFESLPQPAPHDPAVLEQMLTGMPGVSLCVVLEHLEMVFLVVEEGFSLGCAATTPEGTVGSSALRT